MAAQGFDLNKAPEGWDLNNPIDWDAIGEWEGPAHALDYDFIWGDREEQGHSAQEDHAPSGGQGVEQGSNRRKRTFYPDDFKISIYLELLAKTNPPVLRRGVSKEVAQKFGVPPRVVQRIWRQGQDAGGLCGVVNKLTKNCGRKRIEIDMEAIKSVPLRERTTFQDLANALGVKKSTLHNRYKEGYFRRHTNDLKFALTDDNKKARVEYCLSMLLNDYPNGPIFNSMYNIVYIDEKWFYRTRRNQKYYLANDEERPQREVKSKNFIEKVMVLTVVTRPRFDENGTCIFDGKIGVFPFVYVEPAKRSSANRPRGTMVTKAMTSVTKDVSRDFLVNKVLPAIKEKWPAEERGMPIFIQQDNAKTHIDVNDADFVQAAQADGWDIRLTCQPPNSPDLNVLDLGFFAAIQALFHKGTPNNIEQIVERINQAFCEYPVDRSNRIFLTQQSCMLEIMKHNGGQHYNIPHTKKKTLEMQGALPTSFHCPIELYNQACQFIS